MACQENVSLIAIGLGVYAWAGRRSKRWFLTPLSLGVVYFVVIVGIVLPRLNPNIQFMKLYGHLGDSLPAVLTTIVLHPFRTASYMFTPAKLAFIGSLLGPLAFLSLLSPVSFIPLLPVLAQRLLSIRASEASITYHYQAEFIPFVFFACIYGVKRVLALKRSAFTWGTGFALCMFPLMAWFSTNVSTDIADWLRPDGESVSRKLHYDRVLGSIRPDDTVLATFEFLPHLTPVAGLYAFHHVYAGHFTLSDIPYPTPDIDTILMNTMDPLTFGPSGFYLRRNHKQIQQILEERPWALSYSSEGVLVFRRLEGGELPPTIPLAGEAPFLPNASRSVSQISTDDALLLGFNIRPLKPKGMAQLDLFWKRPEGYARDFEVTITMSDMESVWTRRLAPGGRIWPPQSWPPHTVIRDSHRIIFPSGVPRQSDLHIHAELHPCVER